jgi:hypothetical protein
MSDNFNDFLIFWTNGPALRTGAFRHKEYSSELFLVFYVAKFFENWCPQTCARAALLHVVTTKSTKDSVPDNFIFTFQ